MNKGIENLSEEIVRIIDSYIPCETLMQIPIDKFLFHYLNVEGIYLLYSDKTIIYIGCSINIGSRLKAHIISERFKDIITDIKIIRFPFGVNSIRVEAEFIQEFQPTYNKNNPYLYGFSLPEGFDLEKSIKEIKDSIK